MKKIILISAISWLALSCDDSAKNTPPADTAQAEKSNPPAMDTQKLQSEVMQAEEALLTALRSGDLMKGVGMHLNAPGYRNIWNGEIKTYDMLETRIKAGMEKGLTSIDYQVSARDYNFINETNVLATLTATETTHFAGNLITSGVTAISILWQKVEGQWRLGYLHASELPKEAGK